MTTYLQSYHIGGEILREYLKLLRESRNMTMQYVADKIGISRQYYQQIEADLRKSTLNTIIWI